MTDHEAPAARWWEDAKAREIKRLRRLITEDPSGGTLGALTEVFRPGWVPPRRLPYLPSLWKIVEHWLYRGIFKADPWSPHCFACWRDVPPEVMEGAETCKDRWLRANSWLERGHLVNRARYGLDGVQNLVPLCHACNRIMPIFDSPAKPGPIEWVRAGGWQQYFEWTADNKPVGRRVPPEHYGGVTVPVMIVGGMVPRSRTVIADEERRKKMLS